MYEFFSGAGPGAAIAAAEGVGLRRSVLLCVPRIRFCSAGDGAADHAVPRIRTWNAFATSKQEFAILRGLGRSAQGGIS
jgi:hypothetical protein